MDDARLDLRFLVPIGNENKWSDLLATMIEADPVPMAEVLGLPEMADGITVAREHTGGSQEDRLDLWLESIGGLTVAIEAKVLSVLGRDQLDRYQQRFEGAVKYVVLYSDRLGLNAPTDSAWESLSWERVIKAYEASAVPWVAQFAAAWTAHMDAQMPIVHAGTAWNAIPERHSVILGLRARVSWLAHELRPDWPLEADVVPSSQGKHWVARLYRDAAKPGYQAVLDVQERLSSFALKWDATADLLLGPVALIALKQRDVTTSEGFDWEYLARMWPLMEASPVAALGGLGTWVETSAARKAPHDKAGYQAMVAAGAPKFLGKGYGEAQTKITGECMFGAFLRFDRGITLGELRDALLRLGDLLNEMAELA